MVHPIWLTLGAIAGYLLLMWTNPARASLRDGARVVRRYPVLWLTLSAFALGYALYELGVRFFLSGYFTGDEQPAFQWSRAGSWWQLNPGGLRAASRDAFLPALDSTAGLFNNLLSTYPIAALAALLLLINWRGHQRVLLRALSKRFGRWGLAVHACIVLCAVAAIIKPFLAWLIIQFHSAFWAQWSSVFAWLSFLFEYIFGVCIQLYLILLAYCWVRGLTFDHQRLLDFAIRRFSFVMRFAAVVMLLSSVLIDLPLICASFGLLPQWPQSADGDFGNAIEEWTQVVRAIIAAFLLLVSTVQITLTFHSESLRKAVRDHWQFVLKNGWPLLWFLVVAALHFYLIHFLNLVVLRAVGEGISWWVAWRLIFPFVIGGVGAWLLASWVSFYKRCGSGRIHAETWIQF